MSNSPNDTEMAQDSKKTEKAETRSASNKAEKNEKLNPSKYKKLAWILLFLFLACAVGTLVGYGILTMTPKYKFLKAMSVKVGPVRQAAVSGSLNIVKYNLQSMEEPPVKPLNLNGTNINYSARIDFDSQKMLLQAALEYNHKQYPLTAYLTGKQLILDARGYFDWCQINVPAAQRVQVPQFIYTTQEYESKINGIWKHLEASFNSDRDPKNQNAIKQLLYITFKEIPGKYFSKTDSGRLLLSFDRTGLKQIMNSVVEEAWDTDILARSMGELAASNNPAYAKEIEKDILERQKRVTTDEALAKTNRTWEKFDRQVKLNKFSIGIKNEPPAYSNSFTLDLSIQKSAVFPNGGSIVLNGESKLTVKKEVHIKIPALDAQNSAGIDNIKL